MQRPISFALGILVAIGAISALYASIKRYSTEQHNRRVEIVLDYTEATNLAQFTGHPVENTLAKFRAAHVTSLAISEDTLNSLELQGQIHTQHWVDPVTVTVSSPNTLARIKKGLSDKGIPIMDAPTGRKYTVFEVATDQTYEEAPGNKQPDGFAVPMEWSNLRSIGIGIDPESVRVAQIAGLIPIARIANFPGANTATMTNVLSRLKSLGVNTVIFQGLEVFGYRGLYNEAAQVFTNSGIHFGQVEFGKQKGDEQLGIKLKGNFLRVHSISDTEMGSLDETEAVERFVRAARERNIRVCYVRLVTTGGDNPIQANIDYLDHIAHGIARGSEMGFGEAKLYEDLTIPMILSIFMAVGIGAGFGLLLLSTLPLRDKTVLVLTFGMSLLLSALIVLGGENGRRLVAFAASLTFPTLACIKRDLLELGPVGFRLRKVPEAATFAVKQIISSSLVTGIGIINVVGLLASKPFIVKVNQFLGIKASHAVPVFVIAVFAFVGLPKLNISWAEAWQTAMERVKTFMSEPLRVGQLILGCIAIIAIVMILARTGNDPGVGVSGIELKFRSLLDRFLPVRPRTKEFLIGHPAFVIGLALWYRGRKKWALPLFVIGVIGQVSLLNTFCHTHTPLRLSLIRDLTGLVLGTAIGIGIFMVSEWLVNRSQKSTGPVALPE